MTLQPDHSPAEVESLLAPVREDAPALERALDISERAVAVGFEWDSLDEVWGQVHEEIAELQQAWASGEPQHEVALELGDVLFSVVNVGRKMGIGAEEALHATCAKFTRRWQTMERLAAEGGTTVEAVSRDELEELWRAAKCIERKGGR